MLETVARKDILRPQVERAQDAVLSAAHAEAAAGRTVRVVAEYPIFGLARVTVLVRKWGLWTKAYSHDVPERHHATKVAEAVRRRL